jgi:two-component system alkaline phosphatase synthesis response regulator PhoP
MLPENHSAEPAKPETIFIVEDHLELIKVLTEELTRHHYCVRFATDGEKGLLEISRDPPDLIILDLILPGINGWEVCRALRKERRTEAIPLLILTAMVQEVHRIQGFEAGADDYLPKPFSLRELVARIRAMLRRRGRERNVEPLPGGPYRIGPLMIDTERREIRMEARLLRLTRTEFDILKYLARHSGNVLSRDELITKLWGEDRFVEEHNLDVHIHAIRQQLEPNPSQPKFLVTIRGFGYKFCSQHDVG